jgi:hypothetical protein
MSNCLIACVDSLLVVSLLLPFVTLQRVSFPFSVINYVFKQLSKGDEEISGVIFPPWSSICVFFPSSFLLLKMFVTYVVLM